MSYLHLPRIVFSGDFISDVSTVNNDVAHYNIDTFRPSFQEYGQGAVNGWWNPEGGATFNFQNCSIQKLCYSDGTVADSTSMQDLIGEFIEGAEGRSAGKMVDLDPQQQMVSQLWAVKLRITNSAGDEILVGDLFTTAFRDLQIRQTDGGKVNGQPLGATWTSTLENIVWGKKAKDYKILKELKAETQENRLSVNLNGFGYYYAHAADGRFSLGRLLGAIGPWYKGEPKTFVAERRLFGTKMTGTGNNPPTYFNFTNFLFDEKENMLSLDLGASMPVANSMGDVTINNKYVLAVSNVGLNNAPSATAVTLNEQEGDFVPIGDLPYFQGDWLMRTGGIIDIKLSDSVGELLKDKQLIMLQVVDGQTNLVAREAWNGYNVRADQMVQRIDADDTSPVDFYAMQWGRPMKSGVVDIVMAKATKTQPGPICPSPGNNFPRTGLKYNHSPKINKGIAAVEIKGNKIHCPRVYLDGQMYFLNYTLAGAPTDYANTAGDAVSVHLRDYFEIPKKPKWTDIKDLMQQFSNLYPIMSKYLVDLGDRDAVLARKDILKFAFTQDIHSPMYMPVTRDLSESKRLTILAYLESNGKFDNEPSDDDGIASAAGVGLGKSAKIDNGEPEDASDTPSDFHQKLIDQMRAKMGEQVSFEAVEDLTKL
jgi:hypothetical protein